MNQNPATVDLSGKRAVITGASRGIGRSIALALGRAGAAVAITARSEPSLQPLSAELREMGVAVLPIACDVSEAKQVNQLAERVGNEWGSVQILVNNAGQAASEKFVGHSDELWHRMLAVNLTGVFLVTRALLPMMIDGTTSGRIINIASIASKVGGKYIAAYTASKHGVLGLTRALAVELADRNITVNAVCPGYVNTSMTDFAIENIVKKTGMSDEKARQALETTSPQKRLIEPKEVAALTLWLATDHSHGITGQAINVDGGTVMY